VSAVDRSAAACILASFTGHAPPEWVRRWVARGLGGIVLFSKNIRDPEQLASLTADLHAARPELLIATDEEGGDVTRIEAATGSSYPGNAALGVVDDLALTEEVGAAIGADLAAVGVDLDLAPVADVNSNPANPVIGIRSFGSEPQHVARHVAAFVRGVHRTGVAACAKHFPGHGDTAVDSHLDLPIVSGDYESFAREALPPFEAAIEAGVHAIMTAHIRVDALDTVPATLSRPILHDLLRRRLGFGGLVMTDALEMQAIAGTVGIAEGAALALAAGADALCLGPKVHADVVAGTHAAVIAAVREGRLAEEPVHDAAARVAALAASAGPAGADSARDDAGAEAARRALLVQGEPEVDDRPLVIELTPPPSIAAGEPSYRFGDVLLARVPGAEIVRLKRAAAVEAAADRSLVVVMQDAHRHAWEREVVAAVVRQAPRAVVVETGLPLWRPEGAGAYVATFGVGRANLEAAADALVRAQRPASSAGATSSR
jgi:beta-N-acetylhexosaminidase